MKYPVMLPFCCRPLGAVFIAVLGAFALTSCGEGEDEDDMAPRTMDNLIVCGRDFDVDITAPDWSGKSAGGAVDMVMDIGFFPPPTEEDFERAIAEGIWPPRNASFVSHDGTFHVDVRFDPEPVPLNALFDMEVTIVSAADPSGSPVEVRLAVDARMPAHRHGMNLRPRVTRIGVGEYRVSGMLLHMPGFWDITFDLTTGGRTERAQMAVFLD